MAVDKYYGTVAIIGGKKYDKLKELGYSGSHSQFRVVCKAKSIAEANRKAKVYGLGATLFRYGYTCETGNKLEIDLVDKYDFIVSIDGTVGYRFVGARWLR